MGHEGYDVLTGGGEGGGGVATEGQTNYLLDDDQYGNPGAQYGGEQQGGHVQGGEPQGGHGHGGNGAQQGNGPTPGRHEDGTRTWRYAHGVNPAQWPASEVDGSVDELMNLGWIVPNEPGNAWTEDEAHETYKNAMDQNLYMKTARGEYEGGEVEGEQLDL